MVIDIKIELQGEHIRCFLDGSLEKIRLTLRLSCFTMQSVDGEAGLEHDLSWLTDRAAGRYRGRGLHGTS